MKSLKFLIALFASFLFLTQVVIAQNVSERSELNPAIRYEWPNPENLVDLKKQILYPRSAVDANIEGTVLAQIWVSQDGQYENHEILKSPCPSLSEVVGDALPELAFEPATVNGAPSAGWVVLPFHFRLED